MNRRKKHIANESPPKQVEFISLGNEVSADEQGWQLIPFGEWLHPDGLQRFDESSAKKIVGYFKNTWAQFKRAMVGLPVYNGHPDVREFANKYPDKTEYGQVADMEVRPTGLAIKQVLSSAGASLVKAGKKFISPHWLANEVGKTSNGLPIWSPDFLVSVGLTDKPNIPNHSLINSQSTKPMNPELLKLLGLAADATDEQVTAAVTALKNRPEASALANEKTAREAAEGSQTAVKNELDATKTKLTDAQVALANERKAHVETHLGNAVRIGKITIADQETWRPRLLGNFPVEVVALANEKVKVKTETVTGYLAEADQALKARLANGGDEPDGDECGAGNLSKKILEAVAAEKQTPAIAALPKGKQHDAAFANVAKAHPKWFANKQ
jgi:hypothetical protein